MKQLLTVIVLLSTFSFVKANSRYPASDIPEKLKKNANVVIRLDQNIFEIKSIDKAVETTKQVFTIFNKKGDEFAELVFPYDKLSKVSNIRATVYDKNGSKIRDLKKSDLIDFGYSSYSLYDDSRYKVADLRTDQYPYTVEYSYTTNYKFLYFIPNWRVYSGSKVSVEKSIFTVKAPKEYKPRYRNLGADQYFSESEIGEMSILKWELDNFEAPGRELYSKSSDDLYPTAYISPSVFEYDGYRGDMSTWDGVAAWQNKLNSGRGELPLETIQKVRELTIGFSTRAEKVKAVYEYMQERTRYVSIQLGIGGFQPFEASVVDEAGYGDCKALSFYTQSLLEAIDINAHYTWVYGGRNPPKIIPDFPNDNFNHIILCVPDEQDTIWLECTSQTNPFGYLGTFTGDRDVLVITDDGGKIVHTPSFTANENLQVTEGTITLDELGNGIAKFDRKCSGTQYENISHLVREGEEEQKKWLYKRLDITNFEISKVEVKKEGDMNPTATLSMDIGIRNFASVSGTRMFLAPNLGNKYKYVPPKADERKNEVVLKTSFKDEDIFEYTIPEGFRLEYGFDPKVIQSEFGEYKSSVEIDPETNTIKYARSFKMKKGIYPAESYNDLVKFLKKVSKADKAKIVLTKTT